MLTLALIFHAIGIFGVTLGIWINSGIIASIGISLFVLTFGLGYGSTMVVYHTEILPPVGIGIVGASQWITAAIIGLGTPALRDAIGTSFVLLICCGFIVLHIVLLNWLGHETLGKTPEQVEALFRGKTVYESKPEI